MDKILSISIAAYNSEKYIEKALDSIIKTKYLDEIEIFVVDDGGTDNTLSIACEYEKNYPGIIIPVHKENGGYGSTVNYTIQKATGKYYRLLDGDDWLLSDKLDSYIELLKNTQHLEMLVTDVVNYFELTGEKKDRIPNWVKLENGVYDLNDPDFKYLFSMWQLTVSTEQLRNVWSDLPEHTLYTDQLFVYNCLCSCNKVMIHHLPVYCYRIGREGQSVDAVSRKKHLPDLRRVFKCMLDRYKIDNSSKKSLEKRVETLYAQIIKTLLMYKRSTKVYRKIKRLEGIVKNDAPEIYENMWWDYKIITLLRIFRYPAYLLLAGNKGFY